MQRCLLLVPKWQRVAVKCGFDGLHLLCFWLGLLADANSGGWLLDKFGSKKVYTYSLFFWSLFTFLQGFVDMFPLAWAGISMFFMRFMLGFSEAPSFPANARIVAAWFPTKERGTASAIFNSAQYFSLALFFAAAWLADFRLGLGACLYRYGGDWFCVDGAVDQVDS